MYLWTPRNSINIRQLCFVPNNNLSNKTNKIKTVPYISFGKKKLVKFSQSVQCATTKISCIKNFCETLHIVCDDIYDLFPKMSCKMIFTLNKYPGCTSLCIFVVYVFPKCVVLHFVVHFYTWCHHNRSVIFFYLADNSQNAFFFTIFLIY